jgi:hypothetical protein
LEKENETVPGKSLRLWVAILLTIVALWFVDFLLKPVRHRHGTKTKERASPLRPAQWYRVSAAGQAASSLSAASAASLSWRTKAGDRGLGSGKGQPVAEFGNSEAQVSYRGRGLSFVVHRSVTKTYLFSSSL